MTHYVIRFFLGEKWQEAILCEDKAIAYSTYHRLVEYARAMDDHTPISMLLRQTFSNDKSLHLKHAGLSGRYMGAYLH